METDHQPRPEFVADLEWQVRTALRRQDRFSAPTRRKGGSMKLASVILVSALFGAGGVVVKEEVQQARAQEMLVAQVETELQLADLQLVTVDSQLDHIEGQVAAGVVGEDALRSAEHALREAVARRDALSLDWEEIRTTGRAPNRDLTAPLVDGRDFVTERLELRRSVMESQLQLTERQLSRTRELEALGTVGAEAEEQALLAHQEAMLRLDALLERLDLRRRYLDLDIPTAEVTRRAELLEAEHDLEIQQLTRDFAVRRLQRLEDRGELGLVHESEVERARLEVMQLELAQQLVRLRIQALRQGGEGRP